MKICKIVNQIVTLIMKQNLILIMMNMTNNCCKYFNKNKNLHLLDWLCLIVCVNHALLSKASLKDVGFYPISLSK